MELEKNGLDIFYIDESHDKNVYVVTCIAIPFLRKRDKNWHIVWGEFFKNAKSWRKRVENECKIPFHKELHGTKLAAGRGNFNRGKYPFKVPKCLSVYSDILSMVDFLEESSVMSVAVTRGKSIYGSYRLEAAMHMLFQRMRRQCQSKKVNGIVFFDQGHPEYRKMYRKAQVHLPTGSQYGGWHNGSNTRNLPLDMFTKDGNEKDSKNCLFTQLADLIAYSAFLKVKHENSALESWQEYYQAYDIYDRLNPAYVNTKAQNCWPKDGIVR